MQHLDDQGYAQHCKTCQQCAAHSEELWRLCAGGAKLRARRDRRREKIREDAQHAARTVLGYILAGNAP